MSRTRRGTTGGRGQVECDRAVHGGDVSREHGRAGARGLPLQHHACKFVVVDGETVATGSFNFTSAAENHNAENVLVLYDPAVAQQCEREWERLWSESEEMKERY